MTAAEKQERLGMLIELHEQWKRKKKRGDVVASKRVKADCDLCDKKQVLTRQVFGHTCCATCENIVRLTRKYPELISRFYREFHGEDVAGEDNESRKIVDAIKELLAIETDKTVVMAINGLIEEKRCLLLDVEAAKKVVERHRVSEEMLRKSLEEKRRLLAEKTSELAKRQDEGEIRKKVIMAMLTKDGLAERFINVRDEAKRIESMIFGDGDAMEKVREYLRNGQKIKAIKEYRAISGEGLKEAKEAVDRMEAEKKNRRILDDIAEGTQRKTKKIN